MSDLQNRRKLPHIEVTADALMWYGGITLPVYSISMSVIQNGLMYVTGPISNFVLKRCICWRWAPPHI